MTIECRAGYTTCGEHILQNGREVSNRRRRELPYGREARENNKTKQRFRNKRDPETGLPVQGIKTHLPINLTERARGDITQARGGNDRATQSRQNDLEHNGVAAGTVVHGRDRHGDPEPYVLIDTTAKQKEQRQRRKAQKGKKRHRDRLAGDKIYRYALDEASTRAQHTLDMILAGEDPYAGGEEDPAEWEDLCIAEEEQMRQARQVIAKAQAS